MRLDDGTILMHGKAPYDPAKAHDYYLRTRDLKGRRKGSSTFSVSVAGGQTFNLSPRQLTEQRVYAAKRVNEIKIKLAKLQSRLKEAMSEARKKKAKADKPATAAEKSKAARDSKKYRAKNKQQLATKAKVARDKKKKEADPVAELESKIGEIKKRLSAAISIQRSLAGATKNN